MPLTLQIIAPTKLISGQVTEYKFDELGGSIGRKPNNDFILLDPERFISSKHAIIEFNNNKYYITDTSTNGVFINNSKTALGSGNSAELMQGDKISIGDFQLLCSIEQSSSNTLGLWNQAEAAITTPPVVPAKPPADDFGASFSQSLSPQDDIVDPLAILGGEPLPADNSNKLSFPATPPGTPGDEDFSDNFFSNPHETIPEPAVINEPFRPPGVIPDDWDIMGESSASQNHTPAGASITPPPASPPPASPNAGIIPDDEDIFGDSDLFDAPSNVETTPADSLFSKPTSPLIPPESPTQNATAPKMAATNTPVITPTPMPSQRVTSNLTPGSAVDDSLFDSFIKGAGIDVQRLSFKDKQALMYKIGVLTRSSVDGLMTALRARSTIKSSFRVNKTTIAPVENNPLKFLVTVDDALTTLLSDDKTGYMPAEDAFEEGFKDLQTHQMALMAGMQATIKTIVEQFNPTTLEHSFDQQTGSSLIPGHKKSKNWDCYAAYHKKLSERLSDDFQNVYGEEFAHAYEAQINKLL